jgi:peptide/nickel transport system ATP-binding protein
MPEAVLSVRNLTTSFFTDAGSVRAVDDVSFDVGAGRTLAVVGESGCGKSVTALSILRLIPSPPGRIERGAIVFGGRDLLALPEREMQSVRGDAISMIFQEPMTSLNPVYTVGSQITEVLRLHLKSSRREARERAIEMLELVGIPGPAERFDAYPHQLSGGMRQRVMIAMALICNPKLLIADEPTTALDVTIQAQILTLMEQLQEEFGSAILMITHDLGVVAEMADEVAVMYAGMIVESASVETIFEDPRHPYTRGLLASIPPLHVSQVAGKPRRLPTIEGVVPNLAHLPPGCRFADRCALRAALPPGHERCVTEEPALRSLPDGRQSRCHYSGSTDVD